MNDNKSSYDLHKKVTSYCSGAALIASGSAAFTTAVPVLTGVLISAAFVGGGVAAYNYYKSLEDKQKLDQEQDINPPQ